MQIDLNGRENSIVRAALDVFSDLVEDGSVNVEGVGEMRGGDAAEIVALMGKFPKDQEASPETSAQLLARSCIELLAIVRLQNGNLHADINAIQERAEIALKNSKSPH